MAEFLILTSILKEHSKMRNFYRMLLHQMCSVRCIDQWSQTGRLHLACKAILYGLQRCFSNLLKYMLVQKIITIKKKFFYAPFQSGRLLRDRASSNHRLHPHLWRGTGWWRRLIAKLGPEPQKIFQEMPDPGCEPGSSCATQTLHCYFINNVKF